MWLGHYHSWNLKHWCHWAIHVSIYATEDHANVVGPSVCRELKTLCWRGHLYLRILRHLCGLAIIIYGTGDTAVTGPSISIGPRSLMWLGHHHLCNLRHLCGWSIIIYGAQELRRQMWLGHYHSWNLKHWCHWAINVSIYATDLLLKTTPMW